MTQLAGQYYIGHSPLYGDLPQFEAVGNGQQTDFSLKWKPGCVQGIYVWLGGVLQTPHRAYHIDDQTVIFHKPPADGLKIVIRGISHEVTIAKPADGSIRVDQFATDDTARRGILSYLIDSLGMFDDLAIALQRVFTDIGALRWSLSETPKPGWLCLDDPEQELSINRYQTLYQTLSGLGLTTDGKDGNHFRFVDLRERFLVTPGQILSLGDLGGQAMRQLTLAELPSHNHDLGSNSTAGPLLGRKVTSHHGNYHIEWAVDVFVNTGKPEAIAVYTTASSSNTAFRTGMTGENQPFDQRPPYLASHLHIFAGA